jgi:hypothetical protein
MSRQRQSSTPGARNDPRNAILLSEDNIKSTGAETFIKVDSDACRTALKHGAASERVTSMHTTCTEIQRWPNERSGSSKTGPKWNEISRLSSRLT